MKSVFVITPVTEGIGIGPRWNGEERRQHQRRMAIGRRTGDTRRKAAKGEPPAAEPEKRVRNERRGAADRRRRPDRRIGIGRALDLNELGL